MCAATQEPRLLEGGFLGDMVAARQLFAFHWPNMCTAKSASSALFKSIADSARAHGSILSVLGYFPQQEVRPIAPAMHAHNVSPLVLPDVKAWVLDTSCNTFGDCMVLSLLVK
jgi:hypothetical protein